MKKSIMVAIALFAIAAQAQAATQENATESSGWQYSIKPYLWAPTFEGDIGVGPVSVPVDAAFTDYMGELAGALLIQGEAKHDRTAFIVDGVWMRLSDDSGTPGPAFSMVDVQLDMVLLEAAIGYDVISTDTMQLMTLAGARYVDMTVKMDLTPDVSGVAAATQATFEKTVNKVSGIVQDTVESAKNDIANSVRRSPLGKVDDAVKDEINDLRPRVGQGVEVPQLDDRVVERVAGDEQRDYAEAIRNAIAERAAGLIENELNPIERRNPNAVSIAISRAASESVDSLKKNVSSATRKEIEQAEAKLVAAVSDGVTKAASQDISTNLDWVDPFVGLRFTGKVSERVFALLYGDVGGFGVGSEITWQAFAGMGWRWTDTTTVEAGYRYLYIDYEEDNLDMELDLAGFVMGVGFNF